MALRSGSSKAGKWLPQKLSWAGEVSQMLRVDPVSHEAWPWEKEGSTPSTTVILYRASKPRLLWRQAFSAVAVGVPLLLGVRYAMAEAQEKRRMRLMVDGVGRFGR